VVETLPKIVERLISRCLRKDPARRFQLMQDVRVELEELKEESDSGMLGAVTAERKSRIPWMWTAVVFLAVLSVVAWWYWKSRGESRHEQAIREIPFTSDPGLEMCGNFSPDGSTIAFMSVASFKDLYFRPELGVSVQLKMIGAENTQTLKKGAFLPVWSPDGNWIALAGPAGTTDSGRFFVSIIPRIGGSEKRIAEVIFPEFPDRFASWTPDGKWLISIDREEEGKPFYVVLISVETGEKRRLTTPPERNYGDLGSALSPDGHYLLCTQCDREGDDLMLVENFN
jgi:hypothetical protein